ncbi:hypothetical protein CBR_g39699 [Chara braunii]|uniref:Myb/SANT-like DNA-binding domain-containing protein n=1 Tax=Chara braunii TaxID=69332 RepID=A0A388LSF3_CHABU|nr:hypothetical protein CBR_g39699 [Chara braunii]|eukprot:GBG85133.1 hypothetical protein CBR_g39699 [Chara braunii]
MAAFRDDVDDGDIEDMEAVDDDDEVKIRTLGKTTGRAKGCGRRGGRGRSSGRGGRGGASDDGGKPAAYWSTDNQLRLVRCKREQDMHLAGLGHNYGRMRTKEWKWDDIAKWMANMGTPKEADDCSKKWDNLFQNYKKIQRFEGKSGEADFFKLSNEERKEHNFKFRMERMLNNEIHRACQATTPFSLPTSPTLVVRKGCSCRGEEREVGSLLEVKPAVMAAQMTVPRLGTLIKTQAPEWTGMGGEDQAGPMIMTSSRLPLKVRAIVGGSAAQATTCDERSINVEVNEDARVDDSQGGVVPERNAMQPVTLSTTPRQQRTIVAIGGAMPRQAVPLPATPRQHHAGENVGSGVAAATATTVEPPQPRHAGADVGVVQGAPQVGTGEGCTEEDVASAMEVARAEKKRASEDDEPLVNRVRKGGLAKDLAEQVRLWVDDKSLWTSEEGHRLYNIINEAREHLVVVTSGLPLANVLRSVAMPRSNIAEIRITDAGQYDSELHHYDDDDDNDDDDEDDDDDDNDDDDGHGDDDDNHDRDDELAMWEKLGKALHGGRHWL